MIVIFNFKVALLQGTFTQQTVETKIKW